MKAKDLMIGDWFRFRYTIDGREIVRTFRISQIENELGKYYVWGDGFGRMCYPERLEPIPITLDVLKKNGFENVGCEVYQCDVRPFYIWWESDRSRLGIDIDNSFDKENFDQMLRIPVVYIHELQHALRLCGIDKEIVI